MTQTKFTKGPWVVKPIEDDKEYIRVRGSVLGGKFKIANISDLKDHHYDHDWCKFDRAESLANAHLIAAAPEMYEALELACGEIYSLINDINKRITTENNRSYSLDPPDLIDMQTCHDIQMLLAKARGKV